MLMTAYLVWYYHQGLWSIETPHPTYLPKKEEKCDLASNKRFWWYKKKGKWKEKETTSSLKSFPRKIYSNRSGHGRVDEIRAPSRICSDRRVHWSLIGPRTHTVRPIGRLTDATGRWSQAVGIGARGGGHAAGTVGSRHTVRSIVGTGVPTIPFVWMAFATNLCQCLNLLSAITLKKKKKIGLQTIG